MNISTNEFQTPLTDELLNSLHTEVREELLEIINSIPIIRSLISSDRKRAKDLPRDSQGRIIIDLVNPHILEDMDYFIETRKHYEEHGVYTFLKPNLNKNSSFFKWFIEEVRRCREGLIRPSDGEWVTGDMYFHINYAPMMINVPVPGTNRADRVEGFSNHWEGLYWRYHYIEQAKFGGLYNDFKGGNHGAELARRGAGKSYTLASKMAKRLLLGESETVKRRVVTILTAYISEYLADKDGTLSKFVPIIDHCAEYTQFDKSRLADSMSNRMWQMGFKDAETGVKKGSLNTVMALSVKEQEGKIRGKRGDIYFEELGSFPNLISVYNNVRHSTEEGGKSFAFLYLIGTAGDKDSDFSSAQEMLYHPKGYNLYALPNVYDKEGTGKPYFSFFFPAYINRSGCYNKDGVSDVTKALIEILQERVKTKYETSDVNTLLRLIAEIPITPREAILKIKNNLFPVTELTERLHQIDSDPRFYDSIYVGELYQEGSNIKFRPSNDIPIREYPIKGDVKGAIEIYAMPEIGLNNKPQERRYIIGIDPYDNDQAESVSLGSILVMDLWTDNIVAEYTGRPEYADDFFETARKLALFYNAKINYENNKKGLYGYFQKMNSLYLLEDTLQYLKDTQLLKAQTIGNSSKGTVASTPINNHGRSRLRDWLLKPITELYTDEAGNEQEVTTYNLYNLKGRAFIQELIKWNPEANYDRVSAGIMLMLYREQYMIWYQGDIKGKSKSSKSKLEEDPFFKENYHDNNSINTIKSIGYDGYI